MEKRGQYKKDGGIQEEETTPFFNCGKEEQQRRYLMCWGEILIELEYLTGMSTIMNKKGTQRIREIQKELQYIYGQDNPPSGGE